MNMGQLQILKIDALEERQDLDGLVALYLEFQAYIEKLAEAFHGGGNRSDLAAAHEALRLHLRDEENRFLEWSDGERVLNRPIFSLLEDPDPGTFERDLMLATQKFEYMIRKKERSLRELHERIAVLTSDQDAQAVTHVEVDSLSKSAPQKVKQL